MVVFNKNRKIAFVLGIFSTIIWWYTLILLTQTSVILEKRHFFGLVLALMGFILWFFKFSYTVKSN